MVSATPQAPCPLLPAQRASLRDLRIAVAAADFMQAVAVGVGVHAVVSGVELASWKALGVGVLVAVIAAALRRGLRRAGAPDKRSALPASGLAAFHRHLHLRGRDDLLAHSATRHD